MGRGPKQEIAFDKGYIEEENGQGQRSFEDKCAKTRIFENGDMVLVRIPGMTNKLSESAVEVSRMQTAFLMPFRKYDFTRMPFGLSNAPFTFQRLMDVVLSGLEEFASLYIDDIIVYSKSWVDHLQHIDEVLSKPAEAGLMAKPTKCEWGKEQVEYLGHIVGNGQCRVGWEVCKISSCL